MIVKNAFPNVELQLWEQVVFALFHDFGEVNLHVRFECGETTIGSLLKLGISTNLIFTFFYDLHLKTLEPMSLIKIIRYT